MSINSKEQLVRKELLDQGISNELINEALTNTGSLDLEILIEYIEEKADDDLKMRKQKEDRERNRKKREIEETRQKKIQDRLHKKKVLDQIKADRKETMQERLREIAQITKKDDIQNTKEISAAPDECEISINNLENGSFFRIFLKRTESILKLFIEVEKLTGIKDLEIFDGEELIEDDRRTLDEHGFFPFANLIVKLPE